MSYVDDTQASRSITAPWAAMDNSVWNTSRSTVVFPRYSVRSTSPVRALSSFPSLCFSTPASTESSEQSWRIGWVWQAWLLLGSCRGSQSGRTRQRSASPYHTHLAAWGACLWSCPARSRWTGMLLVNLTLLLYLRGKSVCVCPTWTSDGLPQGSKLPGWSIAWEYWQSVGFWWGVDAVCPLDLICSFQTPFCCLLSQIAVGISRCMQRGECSGLPTKRYALHYGYRGTCAGENERFSHGK